MSNLIPTPRTDKNGRTVTRHMKPESTSTTKPTFKIPAVTIKPTKDRYLKIAQATDTITSAIASKYPEGTPTSKIRANVETYSDATLERITQRPWSLTSAYFFTVGMIRSWDETQVNDYISVSNAIDKDEGVGMLQYRSWNHYPDLHPANNNGDYPAERLSQLVALYRVTEHMEANGLEPYYYDYLTNDVDSTYIEDDDLRNFILHPEEPYNREDIVTVILSTHTYDPDRIKAILDSDATSLSSGIL